MKNLRYNAVLFGLIVIALWLMTLGLLWYDNSNGVGNIGQFGDMFGAVNALFSGLAFVGIIVTINLQSKELKLQRKELRNTRKEFSEQNVTMNLQRFDSTFFQMLKLHHEIIDKLDYEYKHSTQIRSIIGETKYFQRQVIRFVAEDLIQMFEIFDSNLRSDHREDNTIYCGDLWEKLNSQHNHIYNVKHDFERILMHYFLNLISLFEYILNSNLTETQNLQYVRIIISQLSYDERVLIYYYSMFGLEGNPRLLHIIKRFNLINDFWDARIMKYSYHQVLFEDCVNQAERLQKNEFQFKRIYPRMVQMELF